MTGSLVVTAVILMLALRIIQQSNAALLAHEAERQRMQAQLEEARRLEAIGRLAGGVAHDFNNILTIILTQAGLTPRGDGRVSAAIAAIEGAARRAAEMTQSLLALSRRQVLAPRPVDVNEVVERMRTLMSRLLFEDMQLECRLGAVDSRILVDPRQLERVLMNLVTNARDAMPQGGTISVETGTLERPEVPAEVAASIADGRVVWIAVRDRGSGIDQSIREHIFEPFFSTKPGDQGTGLGLAMAHAWVQQSHGVITVESEKGQGSCFRLHFPAVVGAAPAEADLDQAPRSGAPAAPAAILLVEDDAVVRASIAATLRQAGHRVLTPPSVVDAIESAGGAAGGLDLLLTDVVMPGLSGPALAAQLRVQRPALKVLFVSGYAEEVLVRRGVVPRGVHFLSKPFTSDALLDKVAAVLKDDNPGALGPS